MAFRSLFARNDKGEIILNPDALADMGLPTQRQSYTVNSQRFDHTPREQRAKSE